MRPERGEGWVPDWGKASPPSTTFTDNLFTAGEEQVYGSVIQPFVAANGTQRKTKTSKEQDRVSEREKQEKIVVKNFCEISVTSITGAGGFLMSVCMSIN